MARGWWQSRAIACRQPGRPMVKSAGWVGIGSSARFSYAAPLVPAAGPEAEARDVERVGATPVGRSCCLGATRITALKWFATGASPKFYGAERMAWESSHDVAHQARWLRTYHRAVSPPKDQLDDDEHLPPAILGHGCPRRVRYGSSGTVAQGRLRRTADTGGPFERDQEVPRIPAQDRTGGRQERHRPAVFDRHSAGRDAACPRRHERRGHPAVPCPHRRSSTATGCSPYPPETRTFRSTATTGS